jgi:hypothetical protein
MRGKFTKYPQNFQRNVQPNAGIVVKGFNPEDWSYTAIIGATGGGVTFNPNPNYSDRADGFDNVPPGTKQLTYLDYYEPHLTGTFKTVSAEVAEMLCPGSASNGLITPADILTDDMFQDITLLADYSEVNTDGGTGSNVRAGGTAITIKNALNVTGYQWKTNDNGTGEFAFDFKGHYDLDDPDAMPFEINFKEPVRAA